MLTEVAWFAVFSGLIVGIVQLWGRFYDNKLPILLSSAIGAVVGLSLYLFFTSALGREFSLAWQGLSWMVVGILFALVSLTVWQQPRK